MKNNKGLTLIELLAVFVVLSIVALIVVPTIFNQMKEYREQMFEDQVAIMIDAARSWANDHVEELPTIVDESIGVPIVHLQNNGYLDADFKSVKTNAPFSSGDYIQIRCITATSTNYDYAYTYIAE